MYYNKEADNPQEDVLIENFRTAIRAILYTKCLAVVKRLNLDNEPEDQSGKAVYQRITKVLPGKRMVQTKYCWPETCGVFVFDFLTSLFYFDEKGFTLVCFFGPTHTEEKWEYADPHFDPDKIAEKIVAHIDKIFKIGVKQ